MNRTYDILKKVCEENGLAIIDINEYPPSQPNFRKKFNKLTKGRVVALSYVSKKFNEISRR